LDIDPRYDLAAGTRVDRYQVEAMLGRGGMAVVYRVRHEHLGTAHALKILTIPSPSVRSRLLTEGRVQASLRHPNIVAVTDVVEVDGAPGLVLDFVAGPALDTLLARQRLTLEQADRIARDILAGVAHAHRAGLVHRDLKPGNVMLANHSDTMVAMVADFGLAKILASDTAAHQTRSGVAMGTPAYMAPEQIRDAKHVDERADVFSLGALLYELVTGARAFQGADTFELFSAVTSGSFAPLQERAPDLPPRMERAILAALRVNVEGRPPNAAALLDAWVDGTPAPTPTWDEELLRASLPEALAASLSASSGRPADPVTRGSATFTTDDVSLPSVTTLGPAHAPTPPPERRKRLPLAALGLGVGVSGIALVGLALGLAGAWWWYANPIVSQAGVHSDAPPEAPPEAPPVSAPPAVLAPVKPPVVARPRRASAPVVPPPPVAAPPPPPPSTATTGRVTIEGGTVVWLVRDNVWRSPGELAPGTYQVHAEFRGERVPTGQVTVQAGRTLVLTCDALMRMCKPR